MSAIVPNIATAAKFTAPECNELGTEIRRKELHRAPITAGDPVCRPLLHRAVVSAFHRAVGNGPGQAHRLGRGSRIARQIDDARRRFRLRLPWPAAADHQHLADVRILGKVNAFRVVGSDDSFNTESCGQMLPHTHRCVIRCSHQWQNRCYRSIVILGQKLAKIEKRPAVVRQVHRSVGEQSLFSVLDPLFVGFAELVMAQAVAGKGRIHNHQVSLFATLKLRFSSCHRCYHLPHSRATAST